MDILRKSIVAGVLGVLVAGGRLHGAGSGLSVAEPAASLGLVKDGVPTCIIVVDDGVSISEKTASTELQRYLKLMSGAELEILNPVVAKLSKMPNRIVLGNRTAQMLCPEVSLDGLGTDGYVLQTKGNTLVIAGGEKRGTLYAANDFLYSLGVRWWAVGAHDIPAKKTLETAPLNERRVPVLEYRDMLYGDRQWIWLPAERLQDHGGYQYTRTHLNGFNFSDNSDDWGGKLKFSQNLVHSWGWLMRPVGNLDGTFAKHPELWALINGKREGTQPCPMNPKVVEIMTANALRELRENPDYSFIVVGQDDNFGYCRCEACTAVAEAEGLSGPGLLLANKIAEAIEKEFPKMLVMAPAYEWSQKPPKTIKPRHNVGITLCSIRCNFIRPIEERTTKGNRDFADDLVAWGKITKKIYIWDYTTNFYHYLLPNPNLDAIFENTKFFVKNNVKGILYQGSHTTPGAEFSQLRMWVLARVAWDPEHADVPALINEFVEGYYGPAASHIKKYIDLIHAYGRAHPDLEANVNCGLSEAFWLSPETVAAAEKILRQAEAAVADDPVYSVRARHAHLPIQHVLLMRGAQSSTWEVTHKAIPITVPAMAETFNKGVKESSIVQYGEFQGIGLLCDWVADYGSRGAPIPEELKGVDPKNYRLVQACQMDTPGSGHWMKEPEATDGWVVKVSSVAWLWGHTFSTPLDAEVGKTYKVFLRLKVPTEFKPEEEIALCGIWKPDTPANFSTRIKGGQLDPGKFKVVEAGQFVAVEGNMGFFIALAPNPTQTLVYLDCLWIQEVPSAEP